VFWGGFNTALELTNTEKFCTGCHEMRDNVFAELKTTIHFSNRSGVRASCPDCHVPHNWTDKIARKMQAARGKPAPATGPAGRRNDALGHFRTLECVRNEVRSPHKSEHHSFDWFRHAVTGRCATCVSKPISVGP
jgi:nitrate/TMAO reductase-like tetraheme cytochrome c subunit